jgi:hypothetical protein
MKHKKGSFQQLNRMIILMTNGIGGLILFPILDILMGLLSSIIVNFIHLILIILLLHPNYSK